MRVQCRFGESGVTYVNLCPSLYLSVFPTVLYLSQTECKQKFSGNCIVHLLICSCFPCLFLVSFQNAGFKLDS